MRSLLLIVLFTSSWLASPSTKAQTGVITGRVVAEDGGDMSKVNVTIYHTGSPLSTATDKDGNFKFTDVTPLAYRVYVQETRGYVRQSIPGSGTTYYRIGDHAIITMIRGGVITGRVTTANGEPMVGAQVTATIRHDAESDSFSRSYYGRSHTTDDRGVYRFYGLTPGDYVVSVRSDLSLQRISPYDGDAPTCHPSSNYDTAAVIAVKSGGEVAGIDIRYRGERGHIISGVATGAGEGSSPSVWLYSVATGAHAGYAGVRHFDATNSFAIRGVGDGEYEIFASANGWDNEADSFVSPPRRVTIKGADASGIELNLAPRASIAGKIIVEDQPDVCEITRKFSMREALFVLCREEIAYRTVYQGHLRVVAPDDKGEFAIRHINPGRYFPEMRLPAENWYLKSIATAPVVAPTAGKSASAAGTVHDGFTLKAGEKLSGLTLTISSGAASLSGKVVAAKEGTRLPSRLRVHLAPVEAARANDPLRYAEAIVREDGLFAFSNIPPGKYWSIARAVPDNESLDRPSTPIAWDAIERAKLRREAKALKIEIGLKPCQRVTEQIVKFSK